MSVNRQRTEFVIVPGPEKRTPATIANPDSGASFQFAPRQKYWTSGGVEDVFSAVPEK